MNLIEKYGSYDAAKAKQQELSKIAADPQLLLVGKIIKEIGEIEIALLEHRRQHNIFEAEDKVVFTDILNSCVVTFESTETDPMQIVWLTYPDGTAGYVFHLNKIKHATDEEIKAGKRLEVNQ